MVFEYGSLFAVIVILGVIHASLVVWVIVGACYVAAMALLRRFLRSAETRNGVGPTA